MNKEFKKMQKLAGLITENQVNETNGGLTNDDLIYDALLNIDHEQLVSDMLSTAENNPSMTLIEYLKNPLNEDVLADLNKACEKFWNS